MTFKKNCDASVLIVVNKISDVIIGVLNIDHKSYCHKLLHVIEETNVTPSPFDTKKNKFGQQCMKNKIKVVRGQVIKK